MNYIHFIKGYNGIICINSFLGKWIYISNTNSSQINGNLLNRIKYYYGILYNPKLFKEYIKLYSKEIRLCLNGEKLSLVILKITEDCTLRCKYCYFEGGKSKKNFTYKLADKTLDKIKNYIQLTKRKITLEFHGGEPLLNIDVIDYIMKKVNNDHFLKNKIRFAIQSNGTLCSKKILSVIKRIGSIGISIDGPPEINDKVRVYPDGRGCSDIVVENIKKFKENNIRVGLLAVYSRYSEGKIENIVDFFVEELGLKSFKLNPLIIQGRARPYLKPNINSLISDIKRLIDIIIERNKEIFSVEKSSKNFIIEENIKNFTIQLLGYKVSDVCKKVPCGAGTRMIYISFEGLVYACDHIPRSLMGIIFSENSLKDMIHNYAHNFLKEYFSGLWSQNCSQCPFLILCGGGCRGFWICENNNIKTLSTFMCKYRKFIYTFILEKIAENPEVAFYLTGKPIKCVDININL